MNKLEDFNHPCKNTCSGWQQGFEKGELKSKEKLEKILTMCAGNTEYMWAAKIVSIIFDCDFRDAKAELQKRGIE